MVNNRPGASASGPGYRAFAIEATQPIRIPIHGEKYKTKEKKCFSKNMTYM